MGFYREFRYGTGVLYGSLMPNIEFWVEPLIRGGSKHGAMLVAWDISSIKEERPNGIMLVARPGRPAFVPEEGTAFYMSFNDGTHEVDEDGEYLNFDKGTVDFYGFTGKWTYFSMFFLGTDNRWYLAAFVLGLPVSNWQKGTVALPHLFPGMYLVGDGNVSSAKDDQSLMAQVLEEFGFVLDEVKTAAEALIPMWDSQNIVPQATRSIAWLLGLEWIPALGSGVYQDLLGLPEYGSSSLDSLGEKVEAIVRWTVRPRDSRNKMLSLDDSSAEYGVGAWSSGNDAPQRVEHPSPLQMNGEVVDIESKAFFRFAQGNSTTVTWVCGNLEDHYISIDGWPGVYFGAFIRYQNSSATPSSPKKANVSLRMRSENNDLLVFHKDIESTGGNQDWEWVYTESPKYINHFDRKAVPELSISTPDGGVVDVDAMFIGPGTFISSRVAPKLVAWNTARVEGRVSHFTKASLTIRGGPVAGTAVINWGENPTDDDSGLESVTYSENDQSISVTQPDGSVLTGPKRLEVPWELLASGMVVLEHDYGDDSPRNRRYTITVKDARDPHVKGATTVLISGKTEVGP